MNGVALSFERKRHNRSRSTARRRVTLCQYLSLQFASILTTEVTRETFRCIRPPRRVALRMPAAFAAVLQSGALAANRGGRPRRRPPRDQRQSSAPLQSAAAGVVVSLTAADGQTADVTSSALDGTYTLQVPAAGEYKLTGELVAFARFARDVSVSDATCRRGSTWR